MAEPAPTSRPVPRAPDLTCLLATGPLGGGGLSAFVAFLADRLPEHGVRPVVASVPGGARRPPGRELLVRLERQGVEIRHITRPDAASSTEGIDVVSAHGAPGAFVAAASRRGVPVVETLHRTLLDGGEEVANAPHVTAAVAVSDLVREHYLAAAGRVPPQGVVTIPNGIARPLRLPGRAEARARLGLREEFLFVGLGRFALQKNTYALVRAFLRVADGHPGAHLLLAGEVEDPLLFWRTARLRRTSRHRARVHLRAHHQQPETLLAAADAFVLDSFFEGWPLATTEALCAGLPVVMSEVGGAWEQLGRDGTRGSVVPHPLGDASSVSWDAMARARFRPQPNEDHLVEAMSALVIASEAWARGRDRLREESLRRFDAGTCAARHADVLRRAARRAVDGTGAAPPVPPAAGALR